MKVSVTKHLTSSWKKDNWFGTHN